MKTIITELIQQSKFTRAVVCYFINNDQVLLIHRKKVTDGLGQDTVSGIGGKIGDIPEFENETPEQALVRECQEEIGLTPTQFRNQGRVRFIWETKPNWNMDIDVFVVTEWMGEPTETEVAKPVWHPINKLPLDLMWDDNQYWVPEVLAKEPIDAIYLYGPDHKVIGERRF